MQRRNFISDMAVLLPAGMIAPKLLFENTPGSRKLVRTKVLILGAGTPGLFIANKLTQEKIETMLLEPASGSGHAAVYNYNVKAGAISQKDKYSNSKIEVITTQEYSGNSKSIVLDFIPREIKRNTEGFIVTDGTTTYSAEKLIIALPVEMNMQTSSLKISMPASDHSLSISCKRKSLVKPITFRTLSVAKIDRESVLNFANHKKQDILAIL